MTTEHCVSIAKRLRKLREERGLTIQELWEKMLVKFGDSSISVISIRNYESVEKQRESSYKNKDSKKKPNIPNKGMKIETLLYFAEVYGVTPDYILGYSEVKTRKETFRSANATFGLNEKSLKSLHFYKNNYTLKVYPMLNIINILLESGTPNSVLHHLAAYVSGDFSFIEPQNKKKNKSTLFSSFSTFKRDDDALDEKTQSVESIDVKGENLKYKLTITENEISDLVFLRLLDKIKKLRERVRKEEAARAKNS